MSIYKNVFPTHEKFLAARCISPELAEANKVKSITKEELMLATGRTENFVHGDALAIPYFEFDGYPMVGEDGCHYHDYRVMDTRLPDELPVGEKIQRYVKAIGVGARPYIPAAFNENVRKTDFMVFTEGAFKAMSAKSMAVAALPGVTTWAAEKGGALSEDTVINSHILELAKTATFIIVLADSDAAENDQVKKALTLFSNALEKQTGKPSVFSMCPAGKAKKIPGTKKTEKAKRGLDDWIFDEGERAVQARLEWVYKSELARREQVAKGGYVALGREDGNLVVWSVESQQIMKVTPGMLTQPGHLMNIVGSLDWCKAAYGTVSQKGGIMVDWLEMGGDMVHACNKAGNFNASRQRHSGVWVDDSNSENLVVNSSNELFDTAGQSRTRFNRDASGYFYPSGSADLGISIDTRAASEDDIDQLSSAADTFNWVHPSMKVLFVGWSLHAFYAGALNWRTHAIINGPRGAGKSTAQRVASNILGGAGLWIDSETSAAGIRQSIRQDSLALVIDEADPEETDTSQKNRRIQGFMEFLRSASGGSTIKKGTADQSGISYTVKTPGLLAGIMGIKMNAADQSRFIALELAEGDKDVVFNRHPLTEENSQLAKEIGPRIFTKMIKSWGRFTRALQIFKETLMDTIGLGADSRYCDTMGNVLAAYMVGITALDYEITKEDAKALVAMCDLVGVRAAGYGVKAGSNDEMDCFRSLAEKIVNVSAADKRVELTVSELINRAKDELKKGFTAQRKGPFMSALYRLGMVVALNKETQIYELLVDDKNRQLLELFKGTKYASGDVGSLLKRLVGDKYSGSINMLNTAEDAKTQTYKTRVIGLPLAGEIGRIIEMSASESVTEVTTASDLALSA